MIIRLNHALTNRICLSLSSVFNRKKATVFFCNHVVYACGKDLNVFS